jgi:gliding motility-associated lipoprotein GldD
MFLLALIAFAGCNRDDRTYPKPKTYVRIDIAQPQYLVFDTATLPFTFEYPDYGKVMPNTFESNGNWFNINFERFGYVLYLTYVPLKTKHTLDTLISDSDRLAYYSQQKRASGVASRTYSDSLRRVYATTFQIKGSQVATPYQFYITDNNKYFIRGSLNYTQVPNNDSLAPVISRITADLEHLITTFNWR